MAETNQCPPGGTTPRDPPQVRVLVIDDLATMRELIKRVLRGLGCCVDVAESLTQARAMGPEAYDVLLIDEHLGDGRGTDLIASIAATDPDFPRRCVLITGGLTGEVPAGATVLAKPFDPAGLRQVVASAARGTGIGNQASSSVIFEEKDLRGPPRPSEPGSGSKETGTPPTRWRPVELISRLRAHDYAAVTNLIHDGPAQEIGASILALELIRRAVPAELAGRLDEVIGWLAAAADSMRELAEGPPRRVNDEAGLAGALPEQVRLVAEDGDPLRPSELVAVLTVAELLIEAVDQPGLTCEMTLSNRKAFSLIEFKIFCDCVDGGYLRVLRAAAAMFGGSAESGPAEHEWRVRVALPR